MPFQPYPGYDPCDGDDPRVRLSAGNPLHIPALRPVAQDSREGGCPSLPTLPADVVPHVHGAACD